MHSKYWQNLEAITKLQQNATFDGETNTNISVQNRNEMHKSV